jgi:hypothetical protein
MKTNRLKEVKQMEQNQITKLRRELYILVGKYHQLNRFAQNPRDFVLLKKIDKEIEITSSKLFVATGNCVYYYSSNVKSSWIKLRKDIVAAATDYVNKSSEELLNKKYEEYIVKCEEPNKYRGFYKITDIEEKRQYIIQLLTDVKHEQFLIGDRAS